METHIVVVGGGGGNRVARDPAIGGAGVILHHYPPPKNMHNNYQRLGDHGSAAGAMRSWWRLSLKSIYFGLIVIVLFIIFTYKGDDYYHHHGSFMPGTNFVKEIETVSPREKLEKLFAKIIESRTEGSTEAFLNETKSNFTAENRTREIPKRRGSVTGWSYNTSRDTRLYVQSENVTSVHSPRSACTKSSDAFLLVIVCSSMENFHARMAIRETWGNVQNYRMLAAKFRNVTKYAGNLTSESGYNNFSIDTSRMRRSVGDFNKKHTITRYRRHSSAFEEALAENKYFHPDGDDSNNVDDPRFQTDGKLKSEEDDILGNFEGTEDNGGAFDYDYQTEISNVMRIPPRGEANSPPENNDELDKIKNMLRLSIKDNKIFLSSNEKPEKEEEEAEFRKVKFVFLLGQAPQDLNDTSLQLRIDKEAALYEDILQESFIDSYNNLTLKSVMLLKWVATNCADNVKYVMKTDDDMFINIPRLINTLEDHANKKTRLPDTLLMGSLICRARPISDTTSKWYSPRYMFGGKVYPKYLSGTGYVMSINAAVKLYKAALDTPLFHLEDVYVTGMCSKKADIRPVDNGGFSYTPRSWDICSYYRAITGHQVSPMKLRRLFSALVYSPVPLLAHCDRSAPKDGGAKKGKKGKKPTCV